MHSKIKSSYRIGLILITLFAVNLFALDVDVDEIQKAKKIKFTNYRGKHDKIDPVSGVKAIGHKLALGVQRTPVNTPFRYHMKYSIIRAISSKESDKLSADIISIDPDANVDHIKNVRRIIEGYIRKMYRYSKGSAQSLALFATYYNAIHRGDMDYFSKKYKSIVISHINTNNAGISTKYYEWPGKTKLLIPLTKEAIRGKIDAIDPDIISDKRTLEEVRKRGDNIEERKIMVDIREKKLKKDKDKLAKKKKDLDKKKKEITAEKKRIADQKRKTDAKKRELARKEKKLQDDSDKAKKITDPAKRKQEEKRLAKKEDRLKKEKETIKEEEKRTARREKTVQDKEKKTSEETKKITKDESTISDKEKDIADEKKKVQDDEINRSISKDTKKADKLLTDKAERLEEKEKELDKREDKLREEETDKNIYANKFYYLKINEYLRGGHYNNELFMIDAATRKIMFKSPVSNICGRRYDIFSNGIVVIRHKGDHEKGHYLALIDRKTLQLKVQGTTNVFWRSFIEIKDGYIYAITWDNGNHYLAKFDSNLKQVAKSKQKIHSDTFITFYEKYIYINDANKKIIVLSTDNLSLVDKIKP